ncbi:MAG: translation initiation factor IF-3, partial [Myxococcales bacterium]|nr:translation initiation factor IF-3 [Myxococcales bacterium]
MRRRAPRPLRDESGPKVNERIRAPRVMVVDEEGHRLGEFLTRDALQLARDRGFDLVEVAPDGRPPICRLADWGKMKYTRKKSAAKSRRNATSSSMKEVKVRPKTDDHDIEVKTRNAERFLSRGDRV